MTNKTYRQKLYGAFIEPKQQEQSLRNREFVFNVVLVGTGIFMLAILALLLQSFLAGNRLVASRLIVAVVAVGVIALLRLLARHAHYYVAAYALVGFYACLAVGSVVVWGISTPFGILLLGLMIVLASTILSSKHALYAAAVAIATVIIVQLGNQGGWLISHSPNGKVTSELGDAIGHSVVFAILATVSWLFGRETERSLSRAESAEAELEREKATLEVRVAKRTEQLKTAQIEELRQLYNFAEVGQLSTSLLHDLANHLTVLTMEIEDVGSKRHTEQLNRSRQIIGHLTTMLNVVRDRLAGVVTSQHYNLLDVINGVVDIALLKDETGQIHVDWDPPDNKADFMLHGDPIKCGQALAIVVGNAIDAYKVHPDKHPIQKTDPKSIIGVTIDRRQAIVRVTDWGVGIPAKDLDSIFKPAFTTKQSSMGIGLYLARQMVETEFAGSLVLGPARERTEFILSLPLIRKNRAR